MISRTKLDCPVERCNEVSCNDTVCRPVGAVGLSRVGENNPSLLEWKTGDSSPDYMGRVPLE